MIETRKVLWVSLVCPCSQPFVANAHNVPCMKGVARCKRCWNFVNDLRVRTGLPAWETPPNAYPE